MLPTDWVRTSSAPCTATAPQENEYEIHNRHPFAHDIDCHNRCGCAGWKRAWSSEVANHRHTADTCADDCFAGRASVEAFPAQVTIRFNDEIAPTGVGKGYAAFRSVSEAHVSRGRDESDRSWHETRPQRRAKYEGNMPPVREALELRRPIRPAGPRGAAHGRAVGSEDSRRPAKAAVNHFAARLFRALAVRAGERGCWAASSC